MSNTEKIKEDLLKKIKDEREKIRFLACKDIIEDTGMETMHSGPWIMEIEKCGEEIFYSSSYYVFTGEYIDEGLILDLTINDWENAYENFDDAYKEAIK